MKTTLLRFCALLISATAASASFAAGPVGVGYIKLGLTKEAVEKGVDDGNIKLLEPLRASRQTGSYRPGPGEQWFTGRAELASKTRLNLSLKFQDDVLEYISVDLSTTAIRNMLKGDIEEKYGPGNVIDSREEKQCLYRNGSNFKVKSGEVNTDWIEKREPDETIRTRYSEFAIKDCPSDLRAGSIEIPPMFFLKIERMKKDKPAGLF
ncbi:hypothetical protein LJR118_002060 [Acidovorax sp. LjRoot118]|uniref:hypothetical protein n=1 Tax=Acidovorax sp. LjRoot118 TaxID=3342256 RepID=UPI003ECFA3A1